MPPLLELRNIVKRYPGVLALDRVNLQLRAGEVHALVGENGAGKSTLLNILSGALRADDGEILIDGQEADIASPAHARRHGIATIYQEFKLVPALSVADNILLGNEPTRGALSFVDEDKAVSVASEVLSQLEEHLDPRQLVEHLSVAQQQVVEIARALSRRARILAMDEPTASLTEAEKENMFSMIRRLKNEGVGILYVSHRLEEVFEIAERVTVLRDGTVVASCATAETDRQQLVRWMVGRELEQQYPYEERERGDEILRLEQISTERLHESTLTVYRGEILGLAGLVGAGRTELVRAVFGADPLRKGTMRLDGQPFCPRSPREAIDAGVGLLTEDRNRLGLILQMNVGQNITLANLNAVLRNGFLSATKEREAATTFVQRLQIKPPFPEAAVDTLSGGNRQKVILARWLFTRAKLLMFDEPTAGVDVGVKHEIYRTMNALARQGIGIIVVSSDLPELTGICDRIVVMCDGRITGELSRAEATQERIMALATKF